MTFLKSAYELEYNTDPRQLLERIFTVRTMRINDSHSRRKIRAAFVVICYYKINATRFRIFYLVVGGNSGINRYYKLCAIICDNVDSRRGNAVPLTTSVGDIIKLWIWFLNGRWYFLI